MAVWDLQPYVYKQRELSISCPWVSERHQLCVSMGGREDRQRQVDGWTGDDQLCEYGWVTERAINRVSMSVGGKKGHQLSVEGSVREYQLCAYG